MGKGWDKFTDWLFTPIPMDIKFAHNEKSGVTMWSINNIEGVKQHKKKLEKERLQEIEYEPEE